MDHATIEREQLVDRYLLGQLDENQAETFEEHYFGCPTCLDQLEAARAMQRAVRHMAAEDAESVGTRDTGASGDVGEAPDASKNRPSTSTREAMNTQEAVEAKVLKGPWGQGPRLALAAALLLAVLGPAALFLRPGPGDGPGIEANPLLLELSPTRGQGADTPSARVRTSSDSRTLVLSLLLDRADYPRYAVTLLDPSQATVWHSEDLEANALTALSLAIPTRRLAPGDYSLEVEGLAPDTPPVPVGRFRFRVESADD